MDKSRIRARRRTVLKGIGALGLSTAVVGNRGPAAAGSPGFDVLVIGAGVFGIWAAAKLHSVGKRVAVLDAVGPSHSRASSGGESRVTRCGYGAESVYSEFAWRSLGDWTALSARAGLPVFHDLGVLWVHRDGDERVRESSRVFSRLDIPHSVLSADEMRKRYPVMHVSDDEAGFLEPAGGALMARRAVQFLASELAAAGVTFLTGAAEAVHAPEGTTESLPSVATTEGPRVSAEQFVFACGPWLDKVCPDAMRDRLFVTRQEVCFFGIDGAATGGLPVWADLPFYGFPSLESRGFKVANDTHGPHFDPDTGDRRLSADGEALMREFMASRFPSLSDAPLVESRVCQYENTSNGHFVIDRHPGFDNVWIVGGGSGHGFKHGPAVGAHVADLVTGRTDPLKPFLLASKEKRQARAVT